MADSYAVALIQNDIHCITRPEQAEATRRRNLERCLQLVDGVAPGTRLVAFTEYCLQGICPETRDLPLRDWQQIAARIPGPETAAFAAKARERGIFIAFGLYEFSEDWPGRCFNSACIVAPDGRLIHHYRKLQNAGPGLLAGGTPGDVYSAYVERLGRDALFPVANTEIGRLATIVGPDVNFPEVTRALAMRGAEVIVHHTIEYHAGHREGWEHARRARAYENVCYLLAVNSGRHLGSSYPEYVARGQSVVVDFSGKAAAICEASGEAILNGAIDLAALRRRRSNLSLNFLAYLRPGLFAPEYERFPGYPLDNGAATGWRDRDVETRSARETIERLKERGVF